jgi:hypothetical protein
MRRRSSEADARAGKCSYPRTLASDVSVPFECLFDVPVPQQRPGQLALRRSVRPAALQYFEGTDIFQAVDNGSKFSFREVRFVRDLFWLDRAFLIRDHVRDSLELFWFELAFFGSKLLYAEIFLTEEQHCFRFLTVAVSTADFLIKGNRANR